MKVLVSACLAGEACRYNGSDCAVPEIVALVAGGEGMAACPELLGGLAVPRPSAEIVGGGGLQVLDGTAVVKTGEGVDLTDAFVAGARAFVQLGHEWGTTKAILKSRSPSCGVGEIYDGTFSGNMRPCDGVATAALRVAGFKLIAIE